MVRVLDRSHKAIKDYWRSSDILKGINISTAWEEVLEKSVKGMWGTNVSHNLHTTS
jgi:hypothetical protein